MTQDDLARALNVSVHTLRNWEQGRCKPKGPALALLRFVERHPNVLQEKDPTDLSALRPLLERIVGRVMPDQIWLFGSRAEGRARPDSDYDIMVVLSDQSPKWATDFMAVFELTCGLGIPTDIVPCSRASFEAEKDQSWTLAYAAFHQGKQLYDRG